MRDIKLSSEVTEKVIGPTNSERTLLSVALLARIAVALFLARHIDSLDKVTPVVYLFIYSGPYIIPLLKVWKEPVSAARTTLAIAKILWVTEFTSAAVALVLTVATAGILIYMLGSFLLLIIIYSAVLSPLDFILWLLIRRIFKRHLQSTED